MAIFVLINNRIYSKEDNITSLCINMPTVVSRHKREPNVC